MDTVEKSRPETIESSPVAVVQLYDTVLLHVRKASDAACRRDFQKQFDEIMNATRIVDGLNRHLDMEKGGQVAHNLRDMYLSVSKALLRSVGKEDAGQAYDRLMEGLRETRNAWAEICGMPKIAEAAAV